LPLAIQQPSGPGAHPGKYSLDFDVPFLILILLFGCSASSTS
jgi:hypothetical protein